MKTLGLALLLSTSFVLVACGGDKKPAKDPASITAAPAGGEADMPPADPEPAAKPADGAAKPSDGAGAAGGMLSVVDMKFVPAKKGKKDLALEVKGDGSVMVDGKLVAKIAGDEVKSDAGTTMVTVGVDGSLVGNGIDAGYKFEGDELVTSSGAKFSVGDDGTVTMTKDGKPETLGSFGTGKAKRASLVVMALWLTTKPSAGAPPAAKKKK
jgi:hypothetical protein